MHAHKLAWNDLLTDRPMPLIERRRVIAERMMISRVVLSKGFVLASHSHANEQIVVMLSGHCKFGLGAEGSPEHREVDLRGGEVLVLPANVPHSCRAIEESVIHDLFSPVSEKTGIDRA